MKKEAAITVRVPASLKKRLEARARRQRRSLSAQVVFELEQASAREAASQEAGDFLGRFAKARLPSDRDIREVRTLLWGRLAVD